MQNVIEIWEINILEPFGTHGACYGTPLPFTFKCQGGQEFPFQDASNETDEGIFPLVGPRPIKV